MNKNISAVAFELQFQVWLRPIIEAYLLLQALYQLLYMLHRSSKHLSLKDFRRALRNIFAIELSQIDFESLLRLARLCTPGDDSITYKAFQRAFGPWIDGDSRNDGLSGAIGSNNEALALQKRKKQLLAGITKRYDNWRGTPSRWSDISKPAIAVPAYARRAPQGIHLHVVSSTLAPLRRKKNDIIRAGTAILQLPRRI